LAVRKSLIPRALNSDSVRIERHARDRRQLGASATPSTAHWCRGAMLVFPSFWHVRHIRPSLRNIAHPAQQSRPLVSPAYPIASSDSIVKGRGHVAQIRDADKLHREWKKVYFGTWSARWFSHVLYLLPQVSFLHHPLPIGLPLQG